MASTWWAIRLVAVLAVAVLCLGASARIAGTDIHYPSDGWDRGFCGSAYDVALIKRDGYMGGEIPVNQNAIDRYCVAKARRVISQAVPPGLLGLAAGGVSLWFIRRRRDRRIYYGH